jgi:hypothetical protein
MSAQRFFAAAMIALRPAALSFRLGFARSTAFGFGRLVALFQADGLGVSPLFRRELR